MILTLLISLIALFTGQQPALTAQAATAAAIAQAATPSDCVTAVRAFASRRQQELRPPTGLTAELVRQVDKERLALTNDCVTKFAAATIPDKDLAGLAELYSEANQPEQAAATMNKALASKTLAEPDLAAMLSAAVRVVLKEPKGDERNARLETYVEKLDKLPAAKYFDQQFAVHNSMLGYYRYDDLDGGIIKHATWLINAAKTFNAAQRTKYGTNVVFANVDMAEAWAGEGMNDKAIDLLKRAKIDWAATAHANEYIDPEIARLELVGTPGAPLTAPHWLNMPDGKTDLDLKGSVTLLEFSAHWCVPCKESYPGINRLRATYGPQGFRVVVVTQLWGYFQAERPLEPSVEIDRDRTYFAEHGLDVPVAIGDKPPAPTRKADGSYEYQKDPNDDHYRVGGIPQIQLVDKHGVIRLMMVGYDDANEVKLAKMIEGLLKEK